MNTDNNKIDSLAETCEKYYNYVNSICFDELFKNSELAYDITQDTFTELCVQWDRLDKTNIKAWLRMTALHKTKQTKAKYKRLNDYIEIDNNLLNDPKLIEDTDIMTKIIDDIMSYDIENYQTQIYERLKSDEVEISKYLSQGLSQLEISERMEMPYGTVRMKVIRLRDKVINIINEINGALLMLILIFIIK